MQTSAVVNVQRQAESLLWRERLTVSPVCFVEYVLLKCLLLLHSWVCVIIVLWMKIRQNADFYKTKKKKKMQTTKQYFTFAYIFSQLVNSFRTGLNVLYYTHFHMFAFEWSSLRCFNCQKKQNYTNLLRITAYRYTAFCNKQWVDSFLLNSTCLEDDKTRWPQMGSEGGTNTNNWTRLTVSYYTQNSVRMGRFTELVSSYLGIKPVSVVVQYQNCFDGVQWRFL